MPCRVSHRSQSSFIMCRARNVVYSCYNPATGHGLFPDVYCEPRENEPECPNLLETGRRCWPPIRVAQYIVPRPCFDCRK